MARILYIEDDKTLRNTIDNVLVALGHSVLTRENTDKADAIVDQWNPDLVITDHNLGEGKETGLELAKRLHVNGQKVAVFSGSDDAHRGAVDNDIPFFYKPCTIIDILEEMNVTEKSEPSSQMILQFQGGKRGVMS